MHEKSIKMSFQGVDRSLRANGDYDTVEYGEVSSEQLREIFEKLLPQTPPVGDDICPMAVYTEGPDGNLGFVVDSGKITDNESGKEYSIEEAVARARKAAAAISRARPTARSGATSPRFDREAFFLGTGMGGVSLAIGILTVWATLTAPEGTSDSTGFTIAQRLARVLPKSVQR